MLEIKTVTNGPIAKRHEHVCHGTLPWLISFSLDEKAFVDSIAIAPGRWHTAGGPRCCSSGSDAAHCYFGSGLSFSRFCALAHAANAP